MNEPERDIPPEIVQAIGTFLLLSVQPSGGLFGNLAYTPRNDAERETLPWFRTGEGEES